MKYVVTDENLTGIADAIRIKGDTSASLSFPDGFIDAIDAINTGGGSTLVPKTITVNGTYNPASDNADGYSSIIANVKPQYVTGTFEGSSSDKGTAISISIPYAGNGYPVAAFIYPSTGYKSGSTLASLAQKSALVMLAIVKCDIESQPDYESSSAEANKASVMSIFKYSDTDSSVTTSNRSPAETIYRSTAATAAHATAVRFMDNTTMSVFIADTSYGFKDGVEYTYQIVYSE